MKSLENTATIYVPTDTLEGQNVAKAVADEAARAFGGSTTTAGVGRYMKGLTMEVESVTLISVSTAQTNRRQFGDFIIESVRNIGRTLKQESVAVFINGYLGIYEAGVDYFLEDVNAA